MSIIKQIDRKGKSMEKSRIAINTAFIFILLELVIGILQKFITLPDLFETVKSTFLGIGVIALIFYFIFRIKEK